MDEFPRREGLFAKGFIVDDLSRAELDSDKRRTLLPPSAVFLRFEADFRSAVVFGLTDKSLPPSSSGGGRSWPDPLIYINFQAEKKGLG